MGLSDGIEDGDSEAVTLGAVDGVFDGESLG